MLRVRNNNNNSEYKRRHDWVGKRIRWEVSRKYEVQVKKKWYEHEPEPVVAITITITLMIMIMMIVMVMIMMIISTGVIMSNLEKFALASLATCKL